MCGFASRMVYEIIAVMNLYLQAYLSTVFLPYYITETSQRERWLSFFLLPAYHKPYLVAILPKNIEIKIAEPQATVQVVSLEKPRLVCVGTSTK